MNETTSIFSSVDRNKIAALLSIVPGLGHLYKHHYLFGFGLLIGGNCIAFAVAILGWFGTVGLSLIVVPVAYIAAVAASAYTLPDWHGHHHFLHPWTPAQPPAPGEQEESHSRAEEAPTSANQR